MGVLILLFAFAGGVAGEAVAKGLGQQWHEYALAVAGAVLGALLGLVLVRALSRRRSLAL